ncbi:HofP DNA utilization family protein [Escherichia coli]|nr:DUF2531 family protein [Escherichia coli]EJH1629124.1 DUF2531 family protein [Escherichia coli]ELN8416479.1 DUF2531 family protein [Escherichia coli]ELO5062892.1 DUF2531 family protein [Escherichia coli]ELV1418028.1 DUF2531 family protein [Escherichia coli]
MRVKRWLLAGIALCLLTGMRDPFKPPEDLCRISELSQWRYQGMVGQGDTNEAMDSRTTVDADTRRTGGKAAKSDADGG